MPYRDVETGAPQRGVDMQAAADVGAEQRGRRLTNDYVTKAYTVWDSMVMGRTDGALARVITPIGGGEDPVAEADARLQDFLSKAMPALAEFVPPYEPG